jgi:hypothetical protein
MTLIALMVTELIRTGPAGQTAAPARVRVVGRGIGGRHQRRVRGGLLWAVKIPLKLAAREFWPAAPGPASPLAGFGGLRLADDPGSAVTMVAHDPSASEMQS